MGYLVDLAVQSERDGDRPEPALHRREREIARELPESPDRLTRLRQWMDALLERGERLPGRQVDVLVRFGIALLTVLGLLFGWAVAAAVLYYDGQHPVNVVHVLAVFVFGQFALLVLLALVTLPSSGLAWLPGARGLQEAIALLSPGRALALLFRRLPQSTREALEQVAARSRAQRQFALAQKWTFIYAAQFFAVAFNVAALGSCMYRVTFSDLAFAWSTTLEPDVESVHELTTVLSLPWSWVAKDAVPSRDLIEQTLYYRAEAMPVSFDPAVWGRWWPFVIACLLVYGLLPRIATLVLSSWRLHVVLKRSLTQSPAALVALDRLESELIQTQADEPDTDGMDTPQPIEGGESARRDLGRTIHLIVWGGLGAGDEAIMQHVAGRWRREAGALWHAGGHVPVEEDARIVREAAGTEADTSLVVVVKAWEPPVLELIDFLRDLRAEAGEGRLIIVAPVALDDEDRFVPPRELDFEQWRHKVRQAGDPGLVVRAVDEVEEAA